MGTWTKTWEPRVSWMDEVVSRLPRLQRGWQ